MAAREFEIVLARTAGFCMGVRRAVRMVMDAAEDPRCTAPIKTHGPLIHNEQVLQVLERRGISVMDHSARERGGTAVIRAHGLSRTEQDELRQNWQSLLDATCPHVRRVQRIVEEYARRGSLCIVVGDRGHAEVEGVLSYAADRGHVVSNPQEVESLPDAEQVVVVAQTTQDQELFLRIVEAVQRRYPQCEAFDTICRSTGLRQDEVRELAADVDAMIVVGGLHSANTRRLAEISSAAGVPTYHVETESALDVDAILSHRRVGLTAGASTPNWMIRRVIRRLEDAHRRRSSLAAYLARSVFRAVVDADIFAAGGAGALAYAGARLLPVAVPNLGLCVVVALLFVLSQHLINQYMRRGTLYLSEPSRADFFLRNERKLVAVAAGAGVVALLASYALGPLAFGLVLVGTTAGVLYQVRLPRRVADLTGLTSLERIPGSKELFVSLAYASLAALVPATQAQGGAWASAGLAFAACFCIAFRRTLALDLCYLEGDRLVGRETLAGYLGPRAGGRLYSLLTLVLMVVLVLGGWSGRLTSLAFGMLIVVAYGVACHLITSRKRLEAEWMEGLVDGELYAAGLAALVWRLVSHSAF